MKLGDDVNIQNQHQGITENFIEGNLLLHYAATNDKIEFVRALISCGADINAQKKWTERTALMEAATYVRIDVINLLIENEADVSQIITVQWNK